MKETTLDRVNHKFRMLFMFCLLILTFLQRHNLYGQKYTPDLVPPSPNAASLSKVGDAPVNLYGGTPEIVIPIYSVKTRTLSSDIALNYTGANGIKVQDIAGPAGLGWSLVAGGVITRTVRGLPDEDNQFGYCMANKAGLQADISSSTFLSAMNALVDDNDLEPDVFSSTIGGRIVFSYNKEPMFTDEQGFSIKRNGLFESDSTWEIIDTKGNRYLFGKNVAEREHTISLEKNFISSWYLSEIVSPDGETINFTYIKGDAFNTTYVSESKIISDDRINNVYNEERKTNYTNVQIWDPTYLQQISSPNAKLTFSYNDRWDIAGQKFLEKILITTPEDVINTAYRFKNGYFSDGNGNEYARPKLLAVEQLDNTQLRYIKVAGFNYYENEMLPPRYSSKYDHWGYYNNNVEGKRLMSDGAIKASDLNKCKAGILTSIDWPNGGRTEYEYELNVYRKYNVDKVGGGLRIKEIRQLESGNILRTSYSYLNSDNTSSGLLQTQFNPDNGYLSSSNYSYDIITGGGYVSVSGIATVENDFPIFQLFDMNGIGVGYSRVQITYPDQSKEIQIFQDYNEYPNIKQGVFIVNTTAQPNITDSYSPTLHGIFDFYSPAIQQRGLMKEKQLYNEAGSLLQRSLYKYGTGLRPTAPVVKGMQKRLYITYTNGHAGSPTNVWITTLYQEYAATPQLLSEEIHTYAQGSQTLDVKEFSRTEYKVSYPSLTSKRVEWASNGDSLITTTTYPYEVQKPGVSDDPGRLLTSRNIIDPIETVNRIKSGTGETVSNAVVRKFLVFGPTVRPLTTNKLEISSPVSNYQNMTPGMNIDSRCKPKITYDRYAPSGELLQYHEGVNVPTALVWGYRHQLVIAEVFGASYTLVAQYVDTALLNAGTLDDVTLLNELDKIRKNIPGATVKTFTYNPLKGLTSETDAAGRTTYYVYDQYNRLRTVKDMNGSILKQIDYYISTAGSWEDTQIKRCITDASGQYTGEEQVQEIDKDPLSTTYNQTRWRSLGYTNSCNNNTYVKLKIENQYVDSYQDGELNTWYLTYGDVVAYFYQDPACTVPKKVTNLNVTYKVTPTTGGPRPPMYPVKTILCNGKSSILARLEIQREQTMDFPPADIYFNYSLSPGAGYIIK